MSRSNDDGRRATLISAMTILAASVGVAMPAASEAGSPAGNENAQMRLAESGKPPALKSDAIKSDAGKLNPESTQMKGNQIKLPSDQHKDLAQPAGNAPLQSRQSKF